MYMSAFVLQCSVKCVSKCNWATINAGHPQAQALPACLETDTYILYLLFTILRWVKYNFIYLEEIFLPRHCNNYRLMSRPNIATEVKHCIVLNYVSYCLLYQQNKTRYEKKKIQ